MNTTFSYVLTLGPIGYYPARGTVASVISCILAAVLYALLSFELYVLMSASFTILSYMLIAREVPMDKVTDPQCIVLDEAAAVFWLILGFKGTLLDLLLRLLFFRFFDITKIFISPMERLKGAAGILGDDLAAALVTLGIMILCYRINIL